MTTSLFADQVPAATSVDDSSAVELGAAFTASSAGSVTAVRFFKGAGNTGTHTGSIWDAAGTRLATVTFTGETASGLAASRPVHARADHRRSDVRRVLLRAQRALLGDVRRVREPVGCGPLTVGSSGNGRYRYGTGGGYPTDTWGQTNYFVDVVFTS